MRRLLVAALLLLAVTASAPAQDQPPASPPKPLTTEQAADAVLAAVLAKDDAALTALATKDDPDPWLVADELCGRGSEDAAARFARAAPESPDVAMLARFVESRVASPVSADVKALLARTAKQAESDELIPLIESARSGAAPFDRVRLSTALATLLRKHGRDADSAAALLDAAEAAATIGWLRAESDSFMQAALWQTNSADYAASRSTWIRELELEKKRGRADLVAGCCWNLGSVATRTGDYSTAVARYLESLALSAGPGPREDERATRVFYNLAVVHGLRGDYARALATCESGLARLPASGVAPERINLHRAEGDAYLSLGETERALAAHREALSIAEAVKDAVRTATSRASIARDLVVVGDLDGAKAALEEALVSVEASGKSESLVMRIIANLGNVCALRGETDAAKRHGERALAIATKLKDEDTAANVMQGLAVACRGAGELDAADAWASKSLEIAERLDSPHLRSDGWRETAANALARKEYPRAVDAARHAIAEVVRMTSGLAEGQGAQAREQYAKLFRMANTAAIAAGDAASLFEFAESGRAVEFLTSLEQGDAIRDAAVPEALRKPEEETRIAETTASLRLDAARAAGDLATTKARRAELETARAAHEACVERIRREAKSAGAIYSTVTKSEDLRAALAADDAFVVYALSDDAAAALVLTTKEMRLIALGPSKDIASACAAWDPAADDAAAAASIAALTKALVSPLKLPETTHRVLVSPDGEIFRAPLAAIFAGRELVHAPSASSYLLLARDKTLRGTKVLAIGAPEYTGRSLTALPESGAEARAVGDVVVTGAAATEAGVRAAIAKETRWRSIHFAVHGLVDEKRPMRSGLALTAADPDDGVLTAMEVVTSATPADLVVLSACDSGGGRVFAGEGLVGMPRAFLFAGSPRVIASSWKVDDAATRALMTKFYELWNPKTGKGVGAAAALRGAQEFVRSQEKWKHPRFWAAWVLWGLPE